MKFKGKNVLITGGTGSIGRALTHAFAKNHARVFINGIRIELIEEQVSQLQSDHLNTIASPGDISNEHDVHVIFDTLLEYGGVDILVNSAAIRPRQDFADIAPSDWDNVMRINTRGPFLTTKYAIDQMKMKGGGVVINLSSIAATDPLPYYHGVHYAASKGALLAFTRSLGQELQNTNISVYALILGPVDTPFLSPEARTFAEQALPSKKPLSLSKIADTILNLASETSKYKTGSCISIK